MDVNVQLMDFPNYKSKEYVTLNEDGSATVFLNSRLTHEHNLESYQHALRHLESGDFDKLNADQIELEGHYEDT